MGLSCGNPTAIADLEPGQVVLDLGSGAGFDVFIAAIKVGQEGRVIGVDMTPEMLGKARASVSTFTQKTGLSKEKIQKMMDAETWMTAKEAKKLGFIDEITGAMKIAAFADMEKFGYEHLDQYYRMVALSDEKNNNKGVKKMDELFKLLGVEDQASAIVKIGNLQALVEINETLTNENTDLKTANVDLKTKVAEYEKKEIEASVDKAIQDGKILPAQKEWATKNYEAFQELMKTNPANLNLNQNEDLGDGDSDGELTFEVLLKDPEKFKDMYENSKDEFDKLYNKFIGVK